MQPATPMPTARPTNPTRNPTTDPTTAVPTAHLTLHLPTSMPTSEKCVACGHTSSVSPNVRDATSQDQDASEGDVVVAVVLSLASCVCLIFVVRYLLKITKREPIDGCAYATDVAHKRRMQCPRTPATPNTPSGREIQMQQRTPNMMRVMSLSSTGMMEGSASGPGTPRLGLTTQGKSLTDDTNLLSMEPSRVVTPRGVEIDPEEGFEIHGEDELDLMDHQDTPMTPR